MVSISNKLQKVFVETKNGQKEFFVFKNTSYPFKILSGESYPIFNFLTKLCSDGISLEEKVAFEKMVKTEMERAFDIGLPLVVDIGFGENWLEAH